MKKSVLVFLLLIESATCRAEVREFLANPRSLAMGGAGIAIVDDQSAINTNPAGLASLSGMHFSLLDTYLEGSYNFLNDYPAFLGVMGGLSAATLNALLGKNLNVRAQAQMVLTYGWLAISPYVDVQGAFLSRNAALPDVTVGYMQTFGVQVGGGFSLLRQHRRKKGMDLRVGVSGKFGFRRGGYRQIPLVTLLSMTDGTALMNQVIGNTGFGWGLDLGTQAIVPLGKRSTFQFGAVFKDINDTVFLGPIAGVPDRTSQNLGVGLAYRYASPRGPTLSIAADYDHILDSNIDIMMRTHFGMELGWRAFKISAGLHQGYWTAGVMFDLWILKIHALTYSEELGFTSRQEEDRRIGLRIDVQL